MYAFETHAYEPMKRTKIPTFTRTYVTQPRLWNGHMYLAKFLLVGGATMLVFGVCVCVCFFAPKKFWFDVWNSTMALGRWGFPKVFCGPSEYLEVLIITLGISRSKGWLSSQNTSETRDPTGRVAPTPVGLVQLNGRLEGSGWLIQRMVRGWFGARWCWDSNFWILI